MNSHSIVQSGGNEMSHNIQFIIDLDDSQIESDNRDLEETVIIVEGDVKISVNPVQLFLNAVENTDKTGDWVLTFKHLIKILINTDIMED